MAYDKSVGSDLDLVPVGTVISHFRVLEKLGHGGTTDGKTLAFTRWSLRETVYVAELDTHRTGITATRRLSSVEARELPTRQRLSAPAVADVCSVIWPGKDCRFAQLQTSCSLAADHTLSPIAENGRFVS
jgi:hypothetical protein